MAAALAAVQLLFSFLFFLWWLVNTAASEFPAGPGWDWVARMGEMEGKQFGEVAAPLTKMTRNCELFPEMTHIEGWALSAKVEPLWQVGGVGPLALLYEEVEVEAEAAQRPRAVIAFRGKHQTGTGNPIDTCAMELLSDNPDEMNTTLLSWCYATYNASSLDYYSQAVAYAMLVLESYPASSVLLCGASMGGILVDLAAAGLLTHYSIDLPVLAFLNPGRRRTMLALGLSLQDHHTSLMGAGNRWDPIVMLDWENRIGTMCLFTTEEPPICSACFANMSNSLVPASSHDLLQVQPTSLHELSQICRKCANLTHDSRLLVRLMLEGLNPTCYLMEDKSLALAA